MFYLNTCNLKYRRYGKVTNLGITVDLFSSGWVTILGKDYSLKSDASKHNLQALPLLFHIAPSKKPFFVSGQLLNFLNGFSFSDTRKYFCTHFNVTNKLLKPKTELTKLLLRHSALVSPHLFSTSQEYPPFIQKLLLLFGAKLKLTHKADKEDSSDDEDEILLVFTKGCIKEKRYEFEEKNDQKETRNLILEKRLFELFSPGERNLISLSPKQARTCLQKIKKKKFILNTFRLVRPISFLLTASKTV